MRYHPGLWALSVKLVGFFGFLFLGVIVYLMWDVIIVFGLAGLSIFFAYQAYESWGVVPPASG